MMQTLFIIFSLILVIVVTFLLVDICINFYLWQSRIKIGRFNDIENYAFAIRNKSLQWLNNTPTIKLTDQSRLVLWDMIQGNYKRKAIQSWQKASLFLALSEHDEDDPHVKLFVDSFLSEDGDWKIAVEEIDGVILAYSLLNCNKVDKKKYRRAFDKIYHLILNLKKDKNTVPYKKHIESYRFVDTIGFICPFLTLYGKIYNERKSIDLAIEQIREFNEKGMFHNTTIPCHCYNLDTGMPAGLFGWGRGLGWYAIGLIDVWLLLDSDDKKYDEITLWVIAFAEEVMKWQKENGSWGWSILETQSRSDSSTVATLVWFLQNASSIDSIKDECMQAVNKALKYLMSMTRRNGAVDFCQGDTKGIGVYSMNFDILPFAQGFLLRTLNKKKC